MTQTFRERGRAATEGEVLAFLEAAAACGDDAAVPAACLPVLAGAAGCRPEPDGVFLFRLAPVPACPCGAGERFLAVLLLVALLPVFVAVSLLVLLFDGRPVFFRQERYGCRGAPFYLFKFRTMVRQSEDLHGDLQREHGRQGRLFKLERDPRVTRLGAVLRRAFLDELPQLVNVARGEMRFVGPRPLPESDHGHYMRPYHALRLRGVPGMTGLWQVAGRNARTFDEMCLLDYYYFCRRTWRFDLALIARTARVVFDEIGLKRGSQRGGK